MKKINPKDLKIVRGLPPQTDDTARIALDTEMFQMDENRMHRPHGIFASLACTMDGKTVYIITDENDVPEFLERIEQGVHIWHNAKFDITQIRGLAVTPYVLYPERERIWDTMLIEQEMFSGYFNEFTLKALVRRWLDIYLEKDTRKEFEKATDWESIQIRMEQFEQMKYLKSHPELQENVMTSEMIEYAAIDVVATWMVYQAQRGVITTDDLDIWRSVDRGTLWTILEMDGMMMDKDAWTLVAQLEAEQAAAIQAKYPEINLNSPKHQVLPHLRTLGKKYRTLQDTGAKTLGKIAGECEFAADVLAFRKHAKAASTYGIDFLEAVEPNGRIYSNFKINGAATGRLSSASPNLENIPRDSRYRSCFIAAPGHVLVDADWSSQEPRIAAFLSQDQTMIDIFKEKKDIYIEAARRMFGWELTKKDPRRNSRMKPTVLGACYGLTEYGMEEQYGVPKAEGRELLDAFFNVFTGLKRWIDEQQSGHEYVTTILGRKYWLNPYQDKSDRNAINSPVQGSAGDALKIAAYRFTHWVRVFDPLSLYYIKIVNLIHDEILVECDEIMRDDVMTALRKIMLGVAEELHPGIPADVEIGFGCNWAKAHET